jgi:hypothetical protein
MPNKAVNLKIPAVLKLASTIDLLVSNFLIVIFLLFSGKTVAGPAKSHAPIMAVIHNIPIINSYYTIINYIFGGKRRAAPSCGIVVSLNIGFC